MSKKDKFLAAAQKFLEKGSLDKALAEFQRAAQEDAKDTRTWLRIAEIHVKRGESAQATQVYLRTADLYVEQGFLQRAVAVYKNVLKLTPGHTEAHFKLADVYKQLGLFSDAAQQYDQAATALQRGGRLKEAMNALAQIVEMNPDQVMSRVKLAEVAVQAGQNDDALREFSRAADQLEQQGRTDDYLRVAERLLTLQPENFGLSKKVASRYLDRQNPKAALAKLQVCFNALPKDVETLQLLSGTFEQLGQAAKTISVLKQLAQVYEELRQPAERNATIQRVLALDASDPIGAQLSTPPPGQPARSPVAAAPSWGAGGPASDRPLNRAFVEDRRGLLSEAGRRPTRRDAAITFSELQVPPTLASQLADVSRVRGELPPDLEALDEEQNEAEVQRILTEADTFVKYGLTERAADHLRRVFDRQPEHLGAHERLAAILVQLGRRSEAVEELGLLAERLFDSQPAEAEKHLRRAIDLDPQAMGVQVLLERLRRARAEEAEPEELDIDDIELEPGEGDEAEEETLPRASVRAEEAAPRTMIADLSSLPDLETDTGFGGYGAPEEVARTRVLPPAAAVPPAAARGAAEEADEWGSGGGGATQIQPFSMAAFAPGRPAAPVAAPEEFGASATQFGSGQPPTNVLDDLDLGLEVGGAPAAPPLDAAAQGEIEQIDFFLEQGLPEEARALLDDLSPALAHHPEVLDRRARLMRLESVRGEATRALPSPIGAVPHGALIGERGRVDKSVTPRAVVTTPGGADATTLRDLGIAYKEMGLHDAAVAEFAKLVDDPQHEVFALTMMGECFEAKGAPAEALLHYKKALNRPSVSDEEATQLYYQLGRVFHTLGDESEALYFFEKVARRTPGFADVSQRVASLRGKGVAPMDRAGVGGGRR